MRKEILAIALFLPSLCLTESCGPSSSEKQQKEGEPAVPAFCDCVNKDYHNPGDKEACEKIEAELEARLEKASVDEKGEILMQINDCKVQGQYDND